MIPLGPGTWGALLVSVAASVGIYLIGRGLLVHRRIRAALAEPVMDTAGSRRVHQARSLRVLALAPIIGLTALLWSGVNGLATGTAGGGDAQERTLIAVLDISGSMRGAPGREVLNVMQELHRLQFPGPNRFDIARDTMVQFLSRQDNLRVGIIVYSRAPMVYRYPHDDLASAVQDLQAMHLDSDGAPGAGQLAAMSGATDTAAALYQAGRVLSQLRERGHAAPAAIILLSDLDDDGTRIAQALSDLSGAGVRVYVLSESGEMLDRFTSSFASNPFLRFFASDSAQDMAQAYVAIEELESRAVEVQVRQLRAGNVEPFVALGLLVALVVFLLTGELWWRRVRA